MFIISYVNVFDRREYIDIYDAKDARDALIGITGDEDFSEAAYRDLCNCKLGQVLVLYYPFDIFAKAILYGSEKLTEAELSKALILIFCLEDSKYEEFKKGRR